MDNNAMDNDSLLNTNQHLHEPSRNHTCDISPLPAVENNTNEREGRKTPYRNDDLHTPLLGEVRDIEPTLTADNKETENDELPNADRNPHQSPLISSGDKGILPPVVAELRGGHGQDEEDDLPEGQQDSEEPEIPHDVSGALARENNMPCTTSKPALPSSMELPSGGADRENSCTRTNNEYQDTSSVNPVSLPISVLETSEEAKEMTAAPSRLDTTEPPSATPVVSALPPLRLSPGSGDLHTSICHYEVVQRIITRSDWTTVPLECLTLLRMILNRRTRTKERMRSVKNDLRLVIKNE
ncbi:hypothetical protein B0T20DRAFT_4331 [Sordaria brevicollis]|uniref:Uncharacterized protein n=1 Tax=Sordaria brevicollis TaxID=83679 RepID=A0AAE0PME9_SORBR|nr:hypothetical protein B0T20DRAFT_4331 [Sordaria brevicollis]